jgi:hypothetical protein
MKSWRGAGVLFMVLTVGSAFGTLDPFWMFADTGSTTCHTLSYNYFRYCDTIRTGTNNDNSCFALELDQFPDTGDTWGPSYDGSHYINFKYQFSSDSFYILQTYYPCWDPADTCPDDTIARLPPRPGYAGFKTAWDYGMNGFPVARYKYIVLAHKGPNPNHRVTIKFWYNNGQCGAPSFNEYIGTFDASDTWKVDTIPIPESVQNKPDKDRNTFKYFEMVFIINNLDPNDTTSGPPGCLKIDNIRLVGCNPIDSSPVSQKLDEGEAATFKVSTTRADTVNDALTFQWKKDGVDIPGANDSVYAIDTTKPEDAGVYTAAVTVSSNRYSTPLSFTSPPATLTLKIPKECGCGTGAGAALIPPLWFKAMAYRKRKKKNPKA